MAKVTEMEMQQILDMFDEKEKALKEVKKLLIDNDYNIFGGNKDILKHKQLGSGHIEAYKKVC